MTSLLSKLATQARIHRRRIRSSALRKRQQRSLLRSSRTISQDCRVCAASPTHLITFLRPEGQIEKCLCSGCGHLFTNYIQKDPALGAQLFQFHQENPSSSAQEQLLNELSEFVEKPEGTFLDFGVGGNIQAFQRAQATHPEAEWFGCDTYPAKVDNYFSTYSDTAPTGRFDGISSYAVIEHLTETVDSWKLFNRLLRPMSEGGGVMIHAFPSLLHHDFDHWAIQIQSHTCLFSPKSIGKICRKTGFKLVSGKSHRPVGPHDHGVFIFAKIKDLID